MFLICHVSPWWRITWACGWESITLSHHCTEFDACRSEKIGLIEVEFLFCHLVSRANFDSYRSSQSGDITLILFMLHHVPIQSKGTWDLLRGSPSTYVTTVPNLMPIRLVCRSSNTTFLFCHVTSRDQMSKG